MPDRRTVLRALLLGGAGLALPAGCGVPSGGPPVVDGPAPSFGQGGNDNNGQPPTPTNVNDPQDLVMRFLSAASGRLDTDDDRIKAYANAKAFLTKGAGDDWVPGTDDPAVVRVGNFSTSVPGDRPDATLVSLTLQVVGKMNGHGGVDPLTGIAPSNVTFTVVRNSGPRKAPNVPLLIDRPMPKLPSSLLLNSEALNGLYFAPQLIYFWDNAKRGLVPDLRYVPLAGQSLDQQRSEEVRWLLGTPAPWLDQGVNNAIPNGVTLVAPNLGPADQNNRLVVNLSAAAASANLNQVMAELRWSLRPFTGPIQLQINSQPQPQVDGSSDGYLDVNLADRRYRAAEPEPFCTAGGVVRSLLDPGDVPAILDSTANKSVESAALTQSKKYGALVHSDGQLWLGQLGLDGAAQYQHVPLAGRPIGRPMWVPLPEPRLLINIGNQLWVVGLNGPAQLAMPNGVGQVTAFSVSPDGRRLALIADNATSVAVIQADSDPLLVGQPVRFDCGLAEPSSIAWSRLDRVVVAGKAQGAWTISEATIDGAIAERWESRFDRPITSVVGYPWLPSQSNATGQVMVQLNNGATFTTSSSGASPAQFAATTPSASPSASPPARLPAPTAPFYLD